MNLEEAHEKLTLLLYDELSFEEEEALHHRLDDSAELRAELERLRQLHLHLECHLLEPPLGLLAESRASLFRRVARGRESSSAPRWAGQFFAMLGSGLSWKPVTAFALLVLSFVAGRWTMQSALPGAVAPDGDLPTVARVREVRTNPNGTVEIQLEEVSQRIISGSLNDREVRDALLAGARNTADPGVRAGTLDLLKSQPDREDVRKVLLYALRNDADSGVRLKALEGLSAFSLDPEIRDAIRKVLVTDANPGVRMQAIGLLTVGSEGPETIGVLQQSMRKEGNDTVRRKYESALRAMNATAGTF
ncbi:MAG: HEAT repeat domain-containing protein [Bryobacterales bacterium]|nr:HEAT repeat domain-containing protein [Bryobacterales bacterium]